MNVFVFHQSYPINFFLVLEGTFKNNLEKHSQAVGFLAKDRLLDYTRFCFYVAWLLFCVFLKHTVDGQNPAPPRMMTIPLFIGFKVFNHPRWCRILSINSMFREGTLETSYDDDFNPTFSGAWGAWSSALSTEVVTVTSSPLEFNIS